MKSLSRKWGKVLVALLSSSVLLTGCVSADVLFSSPTMEARGPAPAAPESRFEKDRRAPAAPARRSFDPKKTVVSLTFDDGNASQYAAVEAMDQLGLVGTFYVNSSVLDTDGYLSREQLDQMTELGHEIGGHGLQHRNLTSLHVDEAKRQICLDRNNLIQWGYTATSYAYPEAGTNKTLEGVAAACGYNTARGLGAIESVTGCAGCGSAESFIPENLMHTKAPAMVESSWSVQDMKDLVLNAEESGGDWVQITFHHVCPGVCNEISVDLADFEEFAAWLKSREAETGTVVRTVDEVIGGIQRPPVAAESATMNHRGANLAVNSGFEEPAHANGISRCWQTAGYGENDGTARLVPDGMNDSTAIQLEITEIVDGDYKFLQRLDLGECAIEATAAERYQIKASYMASTESQFVLYLRDEQGDWLYWTASPWIKSSTKPAESVWITPAIPEGFTGISFGMSLFSEGVLTADEVQMSVYTD